MLAPVVVVGVLGLGYATAATATASVVPRGTTVAGVSVGGLPRGAAEDALADGLAGVSAAPVPVLVGGAVGELDPAAAGLAVDVGATVDAAVGAPWSPASLWRHATGGGELAPLTSVDDAALDAAVARLGEQVGSPAVDGGITFTGGSATAVEPREGVALDADAARGVLVSQWLSGERPLQLPAVVDQPDVDAAAVAVAMERFGAPAVSAPLTIDVGGAAVRLDVEVLTPLLGAESQGGELVGRVDGAGLVAAVLAADPEVVAVPEDARVEIAAGAPRVVPAVVGTTIDPEALAAAAVTALGEPAGEGARTATAELAEAEPEVTTAEAEALGVVERISEFSTGLTPDAGRTENITIAADAVDGTLLLPGETFSLNEVLGKRTPEKGYNEAGVISGGRLTKDFGGGVSQVATTLFNGMFFAGLEDVEHKAHSLYFTRYPEGREATVAWPSVDLKFTNDADTGVLIEMWVAGGELHTTFWGTKVYDVEAARSPRRNVRDPASRVESGEDCAAQKPMGGFDVTVTRTLRQGGQVVGTEEFDTHYNTLDEVRCEAPTPAPAAVPPLAAAAVPTAG